MKSSSVPTGNPDNNTQDAEDITPLEVIRVTKRRIACDGGGALGHPKVWLTLDECDQVLCPYCSRLFVLKGRRGGALQSDDH